ncbi:hypothetical protein SLEP1_g38982 [Rubroshorea leprosula]|uniref:Uncharacterized protein n=1 Tax=Rubroshorea leprosula TaxID=152421 RepID=A0AAV5KYZ1_9ROSI|nr:hypothetical protein SLEP1_g38982 [Rubroshorea leprosula]
MPGGKNVPREIGGSTESSPGDANGYSSSNWRLTCRRFWGTTHKFISSYPQSAVKIFCSRRDYFD